jgi:hypothetical protein
MNGYLASHREHATAGATSWMPSPAGPSARPGVSVRYDEEAKVFWVVFSLVFAALMLGFCFGFAARDLRREARARRRAEKEAAALTRKESSL